jgi:hypothetical protein
MSKDHAFMYYIAGQVAGFHYRNFMSLGLGAALIATRRLKTYFGFQLERSGSSHGDLKTDVLKIVATGSNASMKDSSQLF